MRMLTFAAAGSLLLVGCQSVPLAGSGPREGEQSLTLIEKGADGALTETRIMAVRFSPLQGGERI